MNNAINSGHYVLPSTPRPMNKEGDLNLNLNNLDIPFKCRTFLLEYRKRHHVILSYIC